MQFRVSWRNAKHFLLAGARVELTLDGVSVPLTMLADGAEGTLPPSSATPPIAVLTVAFEPAFTGTSGPVLRIEQTFALQPPSASVLSPGGPQPTEYRLRRPGGDVVQKGRNPLLVSASDGGISWRVIVRTDVVDATAVQPLLLAGLKGLRMEGTHANVRILARTDGKLPLHYICATPPACESAPASDVLCFLTPPQESPAEVDKPVALTDPKKFIALGARTLVFLGTAKHDDTLPPRARDHFSPATPVPNLVLIRRWEEALMKSGKHVALVLPVPSKGSYNSAESGDLPAQLGQIHALLAGLGDIADPTGSGPPGPPRLALAAHSFGGPSLFAAVKASAKSAFSEIWMFEALTAAKNVETVARTGARILYAGYERASVEKASDAAAKIPALTGRLSRLPDPPPPRGAAPALLASSNGTLAHMLEGIVKPATAWNPPDKKLSGGARYNERFEALHQFIVQGKDADGDHFLTKALKRSILR